MTPARRWTCLALLMLGIPAEAHAQARPAPWPGAAPVVLPPNASTGLVTHSNRTPTNLPDTYPRTYWKEGGIIGAVVLGLVGAFLVDGICNNSDTGEEHCGTKAVGGAALGAGVGFAIGSLVGGQFHKGP